VKHPNLLSRNGFGSTGKARPVYSLDMPETDQQEPVTTRRWLTKRETADLLRAGTSTLDLWAAQKIGPRRHKLGTDRRAKVLYDAQEVDAWVRSRAL
jgi:predicted DNA-binding transcriptional regulator AlpA